jgi:Zn-dependent protease with chaperone function
MAITHEAFDALVRQLERQAAQDPRAYHVRLGAFALLGYVYVFAILLLLVVLAGLLVAAVFFSKGLVLIVQKLLIPLVAFIGLVGRSLWVKLEPPEGQEIERAAHPRLYEAIDEIRAATRAPRVHAVLVDGNLNAGVVQVPRLGLFGWQRNYLLLGLPMMQLTTVDEFKAVLAHEFGHLSGAHGRFGAWIYRVRTFWARLADALAREGHWGSFLFVPFFSWYAPRFAAWSFVKARQQEYEADKMAAEALGVESSARALVRVAIKGDEMQRHFWPGVFRAVDLEPEPAAKPFRSLAQPERKALLPDAAQALERELGRQTSNADTHPCLRERIAALAVVPAVPPPVETSAAEVLLGPGLDVLIDHFDASWRGNVTSWWQERHAQLVAARERIATYEGRPLGDDEVEEQARLAEELSDDDSRTLSLYEEVLRRKPGHVSALFASGRILLRRGDDAGIALIDEAMLREPQAILAGCDLIATYLTERGREAEARRYVERFQARYAEESRLRAERETLRVTDDYSPHALPPDALAAIVAGIQRVGGIKRAYLVEKSFKGQQQPMFVVAIDADVPWYRFVSSDDGRERVQALARDAGMPENLTFLSLDDNRAFRKVFRRISGSRIYPR